MEFALTYKQEFSPARPVLKWAGGKSALLEQISAKFPNQLRFGQIDKYIEPFVGGGAVFFEIINYYNIQEVYLFDTNPELVMLYNVIKNEVSHLIDELDKIQKEYFFSEDRSTFYYAARDEYNSFDKNIDANNYSSNFVRRAALTIFLNKTCFNGLFRVNAKALFNVPMGRYANPNILDKNNLMSASTHLKKAIILQKDFSKTLEYADKNTFIYYDPPYRPISKTSSFTSYTAQSFNDNDQVRLKNVFDDIDKIGAFQMLSNSDPASYANDSFFENLYASYNIYKISAKRMINSNAKARSSINELLITNYLS